MTVHNVNRSTRICLMRSIKLTPAMPRHGPGSYHCHVSASQYPGILNLRAPSTSVPCRWLRKPHLCLKNGGLYVPSSITFSRPDLIASLSLLTVVSRSSQDGAEPKTKRGRSAKPWLVVQFHPAPPFLTHSSAYRKTTLRLNASDRLISQITCPQPVCNRDRNTIRPPHLCGHELCCSTAFAGGRASGIQRPGLGQCRVRSDPLHGTTDCNDQ
jgi:hypothetical protein